MYPKALGVVKQPTNVVQHLTKAFLLIADLGEWTTATIAQLIKEPKDVLWRLLALMGDLQGQVKCLSDPERYGPPDERFVFARLRLDTVIRGLVTLIGLLLGARNFDENTSYASVSIVTASEASLDPEKVAGRQHMEGDRNERAPSLYRFDSMISIVDGKSRSGSAEDIMDFGMIEERWLECRKVIEKIGQMSLSGTVRQGLRRSIAALNVMPSPLPMAGTIHRFLSRLYISTINRTPIISSATTPMTGATDLESYEGSQTSFGKAANGVRVVDYLQGPELLPLDISDKLKHIMHYHVCTKAFEVTLLLPDAEQVLSDTCPKPAWEEMMSPISFPPSPTTREWFLFEMDAYTQWILNETAIQLQEAVDRREGIN